MLLYLACGLGLTSYIPEISGKTCEMVTSPSTGSVDFKSAMSNQSQVQKYSDLGKIRTCKYSKRTKIKNIYVPLIKFSLNQVFDQIFTTRDLLPEGNTSDVFLEFLKTVLLTLFSLVTSELWLFGIDATTIDVNSAHPKLSVWYKQIFVLQFLNKPKRL